LVFYEHNNQALGRIACRPQSNDTRAPLAGDAVDPLVQGLSVFDLSDFSRLHTDKADAQHLWLLLRARRERRRGCRAPKQRDEFAAIHSITSSAMASREGGTVRPSILAVSALITSSNFDACMTRRSAGFAP